MQALYSSCWEPPVRVGPLPATGQSIPESGAGLPPFSYFLQAPGEACSLPTPAMTQSRVPTGCALPYTVPCWVGGALPSPCLQPSVGEGWPGRGQDPAWSLETGIP